MTTSEESQPVDLSDPDNEVSVPLDKEDKEDADEEAALQPEPASQNPQKPEPAQEYPSPTRARISQARSTSNCKAVITPPSM